MDAGQAANHSAKFRQEWLRTANDVCSILNNVFEQLELRGERFRSVAHERSLERELRRELLRSDPDFRLEGKLEHTEMTLNWLKAHSPEKRHYKSGIAKLCLLTEPCGICQKV
jgi:hypothetical protein